MSADGRGGAVGVGVVDGDEIENRKWKIEKGAGNSVFIIQSLMLAQVRM